jgi:hypothetical protein
MSVDILTDHTSILHKLFHKNVLVARAGQKNQSGVKSGTCTLYMTHAHHSQFTGQVEVFSYIDSVAFHA